MGKRAVLGAKSAVCACAVLLAGAVHADAATRFSVEPTGEEDVQRIVISGDDRDSHLEVAGVVVEEVREYYVVEARSPIHAGRGCTANGKRRLRCSSSGEIREMAIDLGPGRDVLDLTPSYDDVVIRGRGGDDRIASDAPEKSNSPTRILGGPGDDLIRAGSEEDRLGGGPGDDRIFGGGSRDLLSGDAGVDFLDGGDAQDRVRADDGGRDELVSCGDRPAPGLFGQDIALVDPEDPKPVNCRTYVVIHTR